jgi:hypothetical protein
MNHNNQDPPAFYYCMPAAKAEQQAVECSRAFGFGLKIVTAMPIPRKNRKTLGPAAQDG